MKTLRHLHFLLLAVCFFTLASCSTNYLAATARHSQSGWRQSLIKPGLVLYTFQGLYPLDTDRQFVQILQADKNQYRIQVTQALPYDSLSSVIGKYPQAVAGINGTYFQVLKKGDTLNDARSPSFVKHNTILQHANSAVTNPSYWMNEGAFFYSPTSSGVVFGTDSAYSILPWPEVISGSPVLIYRSQPVGDSTSTAWALSKLPASVKLGSHMKARHPRTAIASDKRYLYFITVDGRSKGNAAGMSTKELTNFLSIYVKPYDAINLDGGGSTTMFVKGQAPAYNGVVNHPSDNKKWDGFGQRTDRSFVLLLPL